MEQQQKKQQQQVQQQVQQQFCDFGISLERTLQNNIELQQSICRELQFVQQQKIQNRLMVHNLLQELSLLSSQSTCFDTTTTKATAHTIAEKNYDNDNTETTKNDYQDELPFEIGNTPTTAVTTTTTANTNTKNTINNINNYKEQQRRWKLEDSIIKKYNTKIRSTITMNNWTRRYFIESGKEPLVENNDTKKRRRYEATVCYNNFYNYHPPWNKKETTKLQQIIIQSCTNNNNNNQESYHDENALNFDEITHLFNRQIVSSKSGGGGTMISDRPNTNQNDTKLEAIIRYPYRTVEECKVRWMEVLLSQQYRSKQQQSNVVMKPKEYSKLLLDIVTRHQQKDGNNNKNGTGPPCQLDWEVITQELVTDVSKLSPSASLITCKPPTMWDCLKLYQQQLQRKQSKQLITVSAAATSSSWTIQEDEILFKYIAAAGIQFVLDGKAIDIPILTNLLPSKTKYQILFRANQTLLNPKLTTAKWNDTDERKLILLMKVYHQVPSIPGDIFLASTHYPDRSTKSVVDKWNRTYNPIYNHNQSFTKDEDSKLLALVRTDPLIGWTELSKRFFTNRHPQRLSDRWYEIASEKDIILRHTQQQQQHSLLIPSDGKEVTKQKPVLQEIGDV